MENHLLPEFSLRILPQMEPKSLYNGEYLMKVNQKLRVIFYMFIKHLIKLMELKLNILMIVIV